MVAGSIAPGGISRPKIISLLLVITALGFASRVLPALPVVFPAEGEVRLLGTDAYYHLRHARFASEHFPALQRWDVGTHYPTGQRADAAGLFDLAIASVAWLFAVGEPDDLVLLRSAAWLPPLLLLLVFPALYCFARLSLSAAWALVACAIFLLSPAAALLRTTLGFADHHAAEILLALLAAGGLARTLGSRRKAPGGRWPAAFGATLPMVGFLFTWLGAPIFALVLGLAVCVACLFEIARGREPVEVGDAAFRYAAALLGSTWLVAVLAPALVMQPWVLRLTLAGCAALALGPLALTRLARRAIDRGLDRRHAAWIATGMAVAAGSLLLWLPEARRLATLLLAAKSDLVREQHGVSLQRYWVLFGPAGVLALLAVPTGVWVAWRRRDRRPLFPVTIGLALTGLWWRTHDYGYLVPPFVAVLSASLAAELLRLARGRASRALLSLGLGVVLSFPIWPADAIRRPWRSSAQLRTARLLGDGWFQAMRWLRDSTPTPSVAVDARVEAFGHGGFAYPPGAYGVLSSWTFGSFVAAIGRRSVVWSRGPNGDPTSAWLLADDEAASLERLCPRCTGSERVRYVVVDARSAADFVPTFMRHLELDTRFPLEEVGVFEAGRRRIPHLRLNARTGRSMVARLYLGDGVGLQHYRMVYESVHQSWVVSLSRPERGRDDFRRRSYPIDGTTDRDFFRGAELPDSAVETTRGYAYDARVQASVKIFEVVKGARLEGSAPGAREVEARLALRSTAERDFDYLSRGPVAPDGSFALVVPYSTDGTQAPGGTRPQGLYSVRALGSVACRAAARPVPVGNGQILEGARIALGSLCDAAD